MAEPTPIEPHPFREVPAEPPRPEPAQSAAVTEARVIAALDAAETRTVERFQSLETRLTGVDARVRDVGGRMSLVEASLTTVAASTNRIERAQESASNRLDDLAPRLSAVEKPLVKKGLQVVGRYGAAVTLAGALAQFLAARDPNVAGALKAIGEALSGLMGG